MHFILNIVAYKCIDFRRLCIKLEILKQAARHVQSQSISQRSSSIQTFVKECDLLISNS